MFWERFYELCKLNNISPNAVCKAIGLSNATATHWKNGKMPNGDVLSKLSDYFNVSVDYLLGLTDEKNKTIERGDDLTNKIISVFDKMDEEEKQKALEFLELFVSQKSKDKKKE